jgi:hypothetical protein
MLVRVTSIQAESGKPFTVQNGPESKIACPNVQRSLQTNMRGEDVRSLQQFLISQSLLTSDATTGFFGTLTQQAVQSFQCTTLGLCSGTPVEDGYGVVGPNTQKAVGGFCTVLKNTTSAQSGDELLTSASIVTPSQTVLIKEFIKAVHHMLFKTEAMQENIDPFVLVVANNKFPNTTYIWNRMLASRFTLQYELPPGGILALSDDAFVEILYDVILKRTPDKAGKEAHLKSLKSGQYRENVFRSILFSAESKSTNAALFATLLLPETVYKPAGKYIGSGFDTKKTTSFSSEDKILMTHFFYWYNSDKNLHIKNSDGTDSLTTHPSTYPSFSKPTFSFDSVAWYEKEMRDMIVAGIDVMLPVYWGFPDQHANTNPWSNAIFKPLEEAMLNLEKEGLKPPKIGMFYDTSTHKVNPIGQLDLTKPIDQVHFARTITDFFSQVPPNRWAQIDNQFYQRIQPINFYCSRH